MQGASSGAAGAGGGIGCGAGALIGFLLLAAAITLFILGARADGSAVHLGSAAACLVGAVAVPIAVLVRQGKADEAARAGVVAAGLRVEASIVDVRHSPSGKLTGWRIIARGRNPASGEEQTFIGPLFRRDPSWHLRERKTVVVSVDPADPSRGVMDLSFIPGATPAGWTLCAKSVPSSFP